MHKKAASLLTILLLLTIILVLFRNAGKYLIRTDEIKHADAAIMLMGSIPDRILQTTDLFQQGKAPKLIIVQEDMGNYQALQARGVNIYSTTQQSYDIALKLGIPPDSILILPGDAQSTQQEATIIRDYLKMHSGIDTITLVTSADHTRRASMIFEKAFSSQGMKVIVQSCPSKYTGYTGKGWWKSKEDIQTVLTEYLKILNFLLIDQWKL